MVLVRALPAAHVQLHKGAGQVLLLPRRRGLTSQQPHHNVIHPYRLARPQRQVTRDAVALVEEPQHRHALVHRRGPGCKLRHRLRDFDGLRFRRRLIALLLPLRRPLRAAGGQQDKASKEEVTPGAAHASSGVQAW